jgi:hypothetical protein
MVSALMAEGARVFTVEEANELVPALELEFGRVARLRGELAPVIEALGGADTAVAILQDEAVPPEGQEEEADRLRQLATEITAAVERINGLGCLVKDLDQGLVDFYSMRENEPVFLCWQFGEPAVSHWHGLDDGFAGRQPIEGVEVEPPEFLN